MKTSLANSKRSGFTLPEIMVSLGVLSIMTLALARFSMDMGILTFTNQQKLEINSDYRTFTNELIESVRESSFAYVYESFSGEMRTPADGSTDLDGNTNLDYRLRDDETGDLLVLYYLDEHPDPDNPSLNAPLNRLVGYFRIIEDDAEGTGPVRRFERTLTAAESLTWENQTVTLESFIPLADTASDWPIVVELARGQADGRLFYALNSEAVIVNAQILHGNKAKRITDTYNFTVLPRGTKGLTTDVD